MDELQLKACLSFLQEVGVIGFIDMFDICNIYVLNDYEAIWKEETLQELITYSRKRTIIRTLDSSKHFLSPRPGLSDSSYEISHDTIDKADIQAMFSLFHPNVSIYQIMNTSVYAKIASSIDIHRFIVYSCIKKILRRIYVYPFISSNPSSFYSLFNRSVNKKERGTEIENDLVGMSMDGSTYAYDEDSKNKIDYEIIKAASRPYYNEIYSCYHYSLFHAYSEKISGMSRHNSLLSFKEHLTTDSCTCKPDKEAIRKRVQHHECLESIAIHLNCCIPSIMHCLEKFDDILFLKVYIYLFLFILFLFSFISHIIISYQINEIQ